MWNCLQRWFARPPQSGPPSPDDQALTRERELQTLRLELEDRNRALANLKSELERHRNAQDARVAETVRAELERLLTNCAMPIAHLLTQAHLLEVEGKPIQAADVLVVAKRLVRTLEDYGLALDGTVGEAVVLDPDRHEPLSVDESLTPGQQVLVKFVGASYRGKIIKKAGVARP